MRARLLQLLVLWLAVVGCSLYTVERPGSTSGTGGTSRPAPGSPEALAVGSDMVSEERPPPTGITPHAVLPPVHHLQLAEGLRIEVVERHTLPVVSVNLVVLSGSSADADKPGLARTVSHLLAEGGCGRWSAAQLTDRIRSLGTRLRVDAGRDASKLALEVTSDRFDDALGLLAAVTTKPQWSFATFSLLRQRLVDQARVQARRDLDWSALIVLHSEFFDLPTSAHPYSGFAATAEELGRIQLRDCQIWHQRHVTPNNSFLVVAGDVTAQQVREVAAQQFRGWRGERPPRPSFTDPMPPLEPSVHVVDHPGSSHSSIQVALLGPARNAPEFTAVSVAIELLGSHTAGRLTRDLVQRRSLASRADAQSLETANGRVPLLLSARTETTKTALATQALLEHIAAVGREAPTALEAQTASRQLLARIAAQRETVEGLAQLAAELGVSGLEFSHLGELSEQLRQLTPEVVQRSAARYFLPARTVVVVAGDATRVGYALSHFGRVQVRDRLREYSISKQIGHNPSASLRIKPAATKQR